MKKAETVAPRLVELFTGCGGMALGLRRAGFHHHLLVEWNKDAARTVAHNAGLGLPEAQGWDYLCSDVRAIDWHERVGHVEMVAGGPPCQPFSMGGKGGGHLDPRDMWPEAIRAVREMQPQAFLFENVRGLLRPAFSDYMNLVTSSLAKPSVQRLESEDVTRFTRRLALLPDEYDVRHFCVNAADYGAAQKRHRIMFVGFRKELDVCLALPRQTHSQGRLLWEQWVSGEYWERHGIAKPDGPRSPQVSRMVARLMAAPHAPEGMAWRTCRDAFEGLGEPSQGSPVINHRLQAGAKVYPAHTGSLLDEPAKALKAGTHGVPGGENMLVLPGGQVRYFSVREAARLQGMPDNYEFPTSWTESMRQLGNAVPTQLAEAFGRLMLQSLAATGQSNIR